MICDKEREEHDAGGKCEAVCDDVSSAKKRSAESSRRPSKTEIRGLKGSWP